MAYADVPAFPFPRYNGLALMDANIGAAAAAFVATAFTFDADTDELALVTRIPKTGTLTSIWFRTGTVSTAGAIFDGGLYTVDTSGLPTTTEYATGSSGTATVATSDDNVWKEMSLNSGSGVTVTKGDLAAIRLFVDTSGDTPNTVQINGGSTAIQTLALTNYRVENTTGSAAKVATTQGVPFLLDYGGTFVYCDGCVPANSGGFQTPGNGAERGLRFSLPVPMRIAGVLVGLGNVAAGADYEIRLYSGTAPYTTEKSVTSIDGDVTNSATVDCLCPFWFATSFEAAANTEYFVAVKQTTANVVQTIEYSMSVAGHMGATMGGTEFYLANRDATAVTNNTSFTETTTTVPLIFLLIDGLDDAVSSGSAGFMIL